MYHLSCRNPAVCREASGISPCFHSMLFLQGSACSRPSTRALMAFFEAPCCGSWDILWFLYFYETERVTQNTARNPGICIRIWAFRLSSPCHFCSAFRTGHIGTGNTSLVGCSGSTRRTHAVSFRSETSASHASLSLSSSLIIVSNGHFFHLLIIFFHDRLVFFKQVIDDGFHVHFFPEWKFFMGFQVF